MRVLAGPAVGVRHHGVRALQDDDRPPLLGRLARDPDPVAVDRVRGLAHQPPELARMRRQDPILAELALGPLRLGERVEPVGVDHERTSRVQREVKDQAPRRAVAAQSRSDDADLRARELAKDRVIRRVPDRAGNDLRHGRRHDLGALNGQDRIDRVGDQQPDQARARPGRRGRREVGGSGQTEAPGEHHRGSERALVRVLRSGREEHGVGRRQHGAGL